MTRVVSGCYPMPFDIFTDKRSTYRRVSLFAVRHRYVFRYRISIYIYFILASKGNKWSPFPHVGVSKDNVRRHRYRVILLRLLLSLRNKMIVKGRGFRDVRPNFSHYNRTFGGERFNRRRKWVDYGAERYVGSLVPRFRLQSSGKSNNRQRWGSTLPFPPTLPCY